LPNTVTVVPFQGTQEQEKELLEAIEAHAGRPGAAMPVLQKAQAIYGYLPEEALARISAGLGLTMSELYGIVSFYAQFSVNPKGRHQVSVCLGTACYVRGAAAILAAVEDGLGCKAGSVSPDGKFSIDATRCIGACGLAPVIIIDGDVYGRLTPDDIPGILKKYTED
jgi:NADH-quinone oxidoreductase subunit E/NADP-reducing hydrogenase subunit HndA